MARTALRLAILTVLLSVELAVAVDVPIVGGKLIVIDKMATSLKAKVLFVSRDPAVSKGTGTSVQQIAATLHVAYDSTSGTFEMPPWNFWTNNDAAFARYAFPIAPVDGHVRTSVIRNGTLLKVLAKGLGEEPLDVSAPATGPVFVTHVLGNTGEQIRHCTQFAGCLHAPIVGGTGYKLTCKGNSMGDPACTAAPPSCFVDLGQTVQDACRGLEWEKKDTSVGSGHNPANLHDVDNIYMWAGRCSGPNPFGDPQWYDNFRCQPNAAAAATCAFHAGGAAACNECPAGDGPCLVDPSGGGFFITTAWDWLNQLNAANFSGHSDWRLPRVGVCVGPCPAGQEQEMESILNVGFTPRIDPVFGPTFGAGGPKYWASTPGWQFGPDYAFVGDFRDGVFYEADVFDAGRTRAVR